MLNRHRINICEQLLRETSLPIQEISERVGFGSVQNFAIVFKKYSGMTASEYRASAYQGQRYPDSAETR